MTVIKGEPVFRVLLVFRAFQYVPGRKGVAQGLPQRSQDGPSQDLRSRDQSPFRRAMSPFTKCLYFLYRP